MIESEPPSRETTWIEFGDECPRCGCVGYCDGATSTPDGRATDGTQAICLECQLRGQVSVDSDTDEAEIDWDEFDWDEC